MTSEIFRGIHNLIIRNSSIGGLHMTSPRHDYANYDQFAPNFNMAYKTIQCVSVPNLKLFRSLKTELWTRIFGEFLLCCTGKWAGGHSFAYQHGCRNINVWRLPKLLVAVAPAFIRIST